ncbi:ATP-grasp ribosomal peptide maturase, SAV_5884 family [Nonomuraea maritima]|uniref:ATP-grasp ribosomal peptide maturase, SAV_5884 family n=1 Tax=Nonomuraea maritima TaxID=683260 RepID=A0A1G9MEB3_9ACTN|nr:ATP-grasp ribosomal peptide maturase [Nonomuraea maritima]SDL72618.1 ATP-grasp ribosomal peptide maturase, SAV_5884 family [Nonomuraea maritima]
MRSSPGTVMVITCMDDVTANPVIAALVQRGARVARVDPADIGPDLTFNAQIGADQVGWSGLMRTPSRDVALEDVQALYYRRPSPWRFHELPPQAREFARAEARHGLDGMLAALQGCRYVNHPAAEARAEMKPAQLQVAAEAGFAVPATLITNDVDAVREFAAEHGPIVYKSFRGVPEAPGGEVAAIWTQRVDPADVDESVSVTAHMFQAEVPKTGDARVTVIGNRVFASEITHQDGTLDWRRTDSDRLVHTPIDVPAPIRAAIRLYMDWFDLTFGAFDFGLVGSGADRSWVFLECNPGGQWAWLPDRDSIAAAIADALLNLEG